MLMPMHAWSASRIASSKGLDRGSNIATLCDSLSIVWLTVKGNVDLLVLAMVTSKSSAEMYL